RRQGAQPEIPRPDPGAVRIRQAAARPLRRHDVGLYPLRFWPQHLPRHLGHRPDQGETARLDHARPVDDFAQLRHFHSARHRQGGARRLAVRCVDLLGCDHRLRRARLPHRDPADRAVRRRQLLEHLSAQGARIARLRRHAVVAEDPRLPLAHHPAGDLDGLGCLRHHDLSHQELVPRGNPQAVCRHRAGQGAHRAAHPLPPRLSQRDADRHRDVPRRLRRRILWRLAPHREHLLARRARAPRLHLGDQPRLSRGIRDALYLLTARPRDQPYFRPYLCLGRSADRFRDPRDMIATGSPAFRGPVFAPADVAAPAPARQGVSPITRRRLRNFFANRRGSWSLWIFLVLFLVSLFSEFIASDRPIIASYKGELLFPIVVNYPESKFGGFLATTNYRDPVNRDEINANGWMFWPLIHYSYNTIDAYLPVPAPAPPTWTMKTSDRCSGYPQGDQDPDCIVGNIHWLGTDDQGRDVVARLLYGFRISVLFGLMLTVLSSVIGVVVGALSGYFGGWTDLLIQRFIDVWVAIPSLYLLLIISSVIEPSFWSLLVILLLFSWVTLVGLVRAEFL